jgi:hypothetical protein
MAKEKADAKKGGKKAETKAEEKPATEGLIREALEAAAKDLVAVMQLVKTPLNGDLAELDDEALKAAIVDAADAGGVSGLVGDGNLKAVQKADHAVEGIDTVAAGTKAVLIALDCDPGVGVREEKGKASKAKAEKAAEPPAEKPSGKKGKAGAEKAPAKEKPAKAEGKKREAPKRWEGVEKDEFGFHKGSNASAFIEHLKASGKKGTTMAEAAEALGQAKGTTFYAPFKALVEAGKAERREGRLYFLK